MKQMIKMIIILLAFLLLLPMVSSGEVNDACFGSGCHSDEGTSYSINKTRYDANSHDLLECVDCHDSSQDSNDPEHGEFVRTLNGTTLTGSLNFSQYNSSNYQLCYYCHNETQLIGLPSGYSNNLWTHRSTPGYPLNISELGTNFVNELLEGYNFDNYPANIHWDHLDMHGINNNQMWDSDRDGNLDSMTSCTACHDPHGNSSGPALTLNDLTMADSTDANGDYGIITNLAYLNQSGDLYCYGCHGSNSSFKYYRTSQNLMEDCIGCHVNGIPNDVNTTAFGQGIHVNINTTDGIDLVSNNDCWMCHYQKDMDDVLSCINCHVEGNISQAPPIVQHTPSAISPIKTNANCTTCHNNSISMLQEDSGVVNINATVSHYGTTSSLPDTVGDTNNSEGCAYCHLYPVNASTWGNAIDLNVTTFPREHPENTNEECWTCHIDGNISINSFHNVSLNPGWDPECTGCHYSYDYMSNKDSAIAGYFNGSGATNKYVNDTMFGDSVHATLSCTNCHTDSQRDEHPPTKGKRKACEDCHVVQSDPVTDTNRHNITSTPSLYKINGTSVVEITDCTTCHDPTMYNNSVTNFNRDAVADCDYCHTYPDKNKENFY